MEVGSWKLQVLHVNSKVMKQIWQFCQKSKLRGKQLTIYKAREGTYWQKCRVSKNWKEANLHKNNKIMDDPRREEKEKHKDNKQMYWK